MGMIQLKVFTRISGASLTVKLSGGIPKPLDAHAQDVYIPQETWSDSSG